MAGAQLFGCHVESDAYIGPNAVIVDQKYPRAMGKGEKARAVLVRAQATIGANAVILAGVEVGRGAVVGAGAVVTSDVPPYCIVAGNPARLIGYVSADAREKPRVLLQGPHEGEALPRIKVKGVSLRRTSLIRDVRGNLSAAELGKELPFPVRRYFLIYDVPNDRVRGEHAHRKLKQFLVCLRGRCSIIVDDAVRREEILLDSPNRGLYLPPMVWSVQYKYSQDALLMVLASAEYDAADYIRDYEEYRRLLRK